jgi:hypothetical protein
MQALVDVVIPRENLVATAQGVLAVVYDLPSKRWKLAQPVDAREQVARGTAGFVGPNSEPPPVAQLRESVAAPPPGEMTSQTGRPRSVSAATNIAY